MKFRRLTKEELQELENEFIGFLAVQSITGPDWVKIKSTDPDKVNDLLDRFSDVVLEKALQKIKYLEVRMPKDWKVFHCADQQIELICLTANAGNDLDFTGPLVSEDLEKTETEIYTAEKKYIKTREEEIFDMLENGCSIASADIFNMMQNLLE